jgi:hypothetical protein
LLCLLAEARAERMSNETRLNVVGT